MASRRTEPNTKEDTPSYGQSVREYVAVVRDDPLILALFLVQNCSGGGHTGIGLDDKLGFAVVDQYTAALWWQPQIRPQKPAPNRNHIMAGIEPRQFWTNSTSPEGGLKLLIDLVQMELCGVDEYYYKGIGKRLTSSDGLASQPYFYDMCYVKKFVVEVWKRCKCAFDVIDKIETFMTEENMGVKINTSVSCFDYSRSQCAFNYVKVFFEEMNQKDIDCPLPCQEKKYAVTVTHEKLTERSLMRHIHCIKSVINRFVSETSKKDAMLNSIIFEASKNDNFLKQMTNRKSRQGQILDLKSRRRKMNAKFCVAICKLSFLNV
uniref:Uncharacterized protein n=1 Tax=Romanomermis culicivorax TaxID=13658 RepID=A0A915IJX3_ROMCU